MYLIIRFKRMYVNCSMEDNRVNKQKFIEYDEDENYGTDEEDEYNEEQELIYNEYKTNTVDIIHKNILDFVIEKSLPICEYLHIKSLKKFVNINVSQI